MKIIKTSEKNKTDTKSMKRKKQELNRNKEAENDRIVDSINNLRMLV